jgi:hypothetical protein
LRKAAGIVGVDDLHDIAGYFISNNKRTALMDVVAAPGAKTSGKTIE